MVRDKYAIPQIQDSWLEISDFSEVLARIIVYVVVRYSRRLKLGDCIRHPELLASDLVLWEPVHGKAQIRGRPRKSSATFVNSKTFLSEQGVSDANI